MFTIILLCQGYCWIRKNTNKEFNWVMILVIRLSSILQFQFFFVSILVSINFLKIFSFLFWMWLLILFPYLLCQQIIPYLLTHKQKNWVERPPNIFLFYLIFLYYLKILCWGFLFPTQNVSLSNISTLSVLVNTNTFFWY